jgi:hypothetical protein
MPKSVITRRKFVRTPFAHVSRFLIAFWIASGTSVLGAAVPATAHDAQATREQPNGWSYPFYCCAGYDCRAVPQTAISERPEGFVIKGTGEVVSYQDTRLKYSPDGEYHWCSIAGADNTRTICLFVPPRSY